MNTNYFIDSADPCLSRVNQLRDQSVEGTPPLNHPRQPPAAYAGGVLNFAFWGQAT